MSAAMVSGWLVASSLAVTRVLRSLPDPRSDSGRNGPLVSIAPASQHEADCLEASLKYDFLVRRVGSYIYVNDAPGHDAPLNALLDALEDCLSDYGLGRIRLTVEGRRYVMYPKEQA